jgi:hypothetical protein
VHCIVTGGGLSADGTTWKPARPDFLFPVKVMRALFRGKLLDAIDKANSNGQLTRTDGSPWLSASDLRRLLRKLRRTKWVVYCKRPFGGPGQVIRYLGQYTHRVAISNSRLVSIDDRGVTFRTRDGNTATLEPVEFLRRFVNHVLPPRFVKIRHYGLLATGKAIDRWQLAYNLLEPRAAELVDDDPEMPADAGDNASSVLLAVAAAVRCCPRCGQMTIVRQPLPDSRAPPTAEAA